MSGVPSWHDDLATLRRYYALNDLEYRAALDRVEAELSRLREERDAALSTNLDRGTIRTIPLS